MASAPRRSVRPPPDGSMLSTSAPRRGVRPPPDGLMLSTSAPRQSARARRPPPRLADTAIQASTSARRRTTRARRPLPQPADLGGSAARTVILHDEIWEEIFLRLDAAADLARASAACSSFRRVVSEPRFLRRFQSLHSPPVLGFLIYALYRPFCPVLPPHRCAPEARALKEAANFNFTFLPDPVSWVFRHARDGRVLLDRFISIRIVFRDFVVCDPLHRRYVMIPRIPDDLMAPSTPDARPLLPVLAPAGENDDEESFRVISTVLFEDKVMAFVFSSCNQTWRGITSTICLPDGVVEYMTYYAHGCHYWMVGWTACALMLDTNAMEFSIIDLPPHNFDSKERAIVEAADGRLGFLTIGDGTIDLYCKNWKSNCVGAQEWLHEKLIPLPTVSGINHGWTVEGTAGHYLALAAQTSRKTEHFLLDLKTLLVENLCASKNGAFIGFPYARFPPPLALPCI